MAYDKVVDSAVLEAGLTLIGDSIRAKGGTSAKLEFPNGMKAAVDAIDTSKPEQTKTATPSLSQQTISPDSGKVLIGVTVEPITSTLLTSLDPDFKAENIAEGVNMFGVEGNHAGGAAVETCTVNITFSWDSYKSGTAYKHLPAVWAIAFKDGDTGELSGYTYRQGVSSSSTHADTSVTFKVLSGDCFGISHASSMALVLDENASGDSKGFDADAIVHAIVCVTSDCSITLEEAGSSDGPSMPG